MPLGIKWLAILPCQTRPQCVVLDTLVVLCTQCLTLGDIGMVDEVYVHSIYIWKTVVSDRVLTLYRPCAYPGAVLRHASGPTGPRSWESFSADQILAPRMAEITVLQKANQTMLLKPPPPPPNSNPSLKMQAFPTIGLFFADFLGSVGRYFEDLSGKSSFKFQPSTYRLFVKEPHTLKVRRTCSILWKLAACSS